jgi:hypothetical protein
VQGSGGTDAGTRLGGVVAALCLVQFVDVLGVTVVVTALPKTTAIGLGLIGIGIGTAADRSGVGRPRRRGDGKGSPT